MTDRFGGDDEYRWHGRDFEDGRLGQRYIEWKYFNFFSDELAGLISFANACPQSTDFDPQIFARIYTRDSVEARVQSVSRSTVRLLDGIGVDFGRHGRLEQISEGRIRIRGALEGLAWDLEYERELPMVHPLRAASMTPTACGRSLNRVLPQSMDWQVLMPRARVTGTIAIDGVRLTVDTPGYCDSNWGAWVPIAPMWNWSQCSFVGEDGQPMALLVGDIRGRSRPGLVQVLGSDSSIGFEKGAYRIGLSSWQLDPDTAVLMPQRRRIRADNGSDTLEVDVSVMRNDLFFLPIPRWYLPDFFTVQQHVRYEGKLYCADGRVVVFDTVGFTEYSGLSLRKQLPLFIRRCLAEATERTRNLFGPNEGPRRRPRECQ